MKSTATEYLPERHSLATLRSAAAGCRACPLWKTGTRTVFGEGRRRARIVFLGEQPGDQEDLQGRPFVGPAGRVLDRALTVAHIARDDTYVTNVVKHFKWIPKGKRRLHKTPNAREISACLPWLEAELDLIRPHVLVCLGATAAKAILGSGFRVSVDRGKLVASTWAPLVMATLHPSAILRLRSDEERKEGMERLVQDLTSIASALNQSS